MPDLKLLCDRPHANTIDFAAARLVVGTVSGLNVNGRKLAMGEEIPQGVLPADALRIEYEAPLRRIELYDFAMKDPELREAIVRHRGPGNPSSAPQPSVSAPQPSPASEMKKPRIVRSDIQNLSRRELAKLCIEHGLSDNGTRVDLQHRLLKAVVGR